MSATPPLPDSRPKAQRASSSTKSISTTEPGFEAKAEENGMHHPRNSEKPSNHDEIIKNLNARRRSASPTDFASYKSDVETATTEATLIKRANPVLLKKIRKKDKKTWNTLDNQLLTNLPANQGFNNGLSRPKPDHVEGIQRLHFAKVPGIIDIPFAVLKKDDERSVTLGHLAGEWKAPDGAGMREAEWQARYYGAVLVAGRNNALETIGASDPDGHSAVTTFTCNGRELNFYSHHATTDASGRVFYHQHKLVSTHLGTCDGLKAGICQMHNVQDRARKESLALKKRLEDFRAAEAEAEDPQADGLLTPPQPMRRQRPASAPPSPSGRKSPSSSTTLRTSKGRASHLAVPATEDDCEAAVSRSPGHKRTPSRSDTSSPSNAAASSRRTSTGDARSPGRPSTSASTNRGGSSSGATPTRTSPRFADRRRSTGSAKTGKRQGMGRPESPTSEPASSRAPSPSPSSARISRPSHSSRKHEEDDDSEEEEEGSSDEYEDDSDDDDSEEEEEGSSDEYEDDSDDDEEASTTDEDDHRGAPSKSLSTGRRRSAR